MWIVYTFISFLDELFFPKQCYGCKKDGDSICVRCLTLTQKSLNTPEPYIISMYSFRDPLIKKAVHAIKYFHRKDLIDPLVYGLVQELKNNHNELLRNNWTLVPIPMPRMRRYMRVYNQAELLAKNIADLCDLPMNKRILSRKKSPKRQVTTRTRSERLQNQQGSFELHDNARGLSIILVDDVTTTGATLNEARKILYKHGAKEVRAVTIAH